MRGTIKFSNYFQTWTIQSYNIIEYNEVHLYVVHISTEYHRCKLKYFRLYNT